MFHRFETQESADKAVTFHGYQLQDGNCLRVGYKRPKNRVPFRHNKAHIHHHTRSDVERGGRESGNSEINFSFDSFESCPLPKQRLSTTNQTNAIREIEKIHEDRAQMAPQAHSGETNELNLEHTAAECVHSEQTSKEIVPDQTRAIIGDPRRWSRHDNWSTPNSKAKWKGNQHTRSHGSGSGTLKKKAKSRSPEK